ncbi:MAG TPA: PAS domain S-box protein [Candidatus Eisenbacteria bacterium]|nr:PAS domain S-box protein [Candidatus Eisenbacteria bacterium]
MPSTSGAWRVEDLPPLLEMLFAASSLGIALFDRDLRCAYVNEVLASAGGRTVDDCRGHTFDEVLPAIGAVAVPGLRRVLDTGTPLLDRRFTDGTRHWLVSHYPIRTRTGSLLGVGSVCREETERKRVERLHEEREQRYGALIDMCPDAIVEIEDQRVSFVNRAAVDLIGAASAEDLIGRSPWQFLHVEDLMRAQTRFVAAMERGQRFPYPFGARMKRLDGREILVNVRGAVYDRSGRAAVQAVLHDVTSQKAAEQEREELIKALAMERELLRTVLSQLPVGVVVIDAATDRLVLANPAADHIWGRRLGQRSLAEPAPGRPNWSLFASLREGLPSGEIEAEVQCGDGETRVLRGGSVPIRNADGAVVNAVATFRDVTDERRSEDALRRAHDELEQRVAERTASLAEAYEQLQHEVTEREQAERQLRTAERLASIGTFAAGIAHEINNPLAAILATAELARALNAEGAPPVQVDASLARIVAEARRGGEIVKGILRFAREEEAERWLVDVNGVVRGVCGLVRERSVPAGCLVRTRLARRLPRIGMKPSELEQVLMNLIQNAAQAGASSIVVQTGSSGGRVTLRVRDNGRGIARKHVDRIFDPFFTTRHRDGGTGLGLSIVHGIVTRYSGSVNVHTREGRGTTFTVELPIDTAVIEGIRAAE